MIRLLTQCLNLNWKYQEPKTALWLITRKVHKRVNFFCFEFSLLTKLPKRNVAWNLFWNQKTGVLVVQVVPLYLLSGDCFVSYVLLLSVLPVDSGSTLHAGWRDPSSHPPGTNPSHANAAQHHPDGPATAARLPAYRRAHHRLLLLADGHHRHHQSRAGQWLGRLGSSFRLTFSLVCDHKCASKYANQSQVKCLYCQMSLSKKWGSLSWHSFCVTRVSAGVKYADSTDKRYVSSLWLIGMALRKEPDLSWFWIVWKDKWPSPQKFYI